MSPSTRQGFASRQTPTEEDYVRAIESLLPLFPNYLSMLRFHHEHPYLLPSELGRAVGYKSHPTASANLHYGKLGRLVGERLRQLPTYNGETADFNEAYPLNVLARFEWPEPDRRCHWRMWKPLAEALESLSLVGPDFELMPGEMPEGTEFNEGAVYRVEVTAYERNRKARAACIAHYGASCSACGFDFGSIYGEIAANFIEVHHLRMISEAGDEYKVDPINDLRPLCPNCHRVVHMKTPPYTIEELNVLLAARKATGSPN